MKRAQEFRDSADRGAIVVTGESSGIGKACITHLTASGYRVYAAVRRHEDGADIARTTQGAVTLRSAGVSVPTSGRTTYGS